jgi:UDP-N-acetyl-D-mannosaminuronate dehydrogenase
MSNFIISRAGDSFEGFDCAVLVTDHRCFNANELLSVIPIIVDSRNFFAEYKEDKRYVNVRSL